MSRSYTSENKIRAKSVKWLALFKPRIPVTLFKPKIAVALFKPKIAVPLFKPRMAVPLFKPKIAALKLRNNTLFD